MTNPRIVIIGGGPAGAAAAARLAQHGRASEILLLERYEFPRDKPCGGGLTGHIEEVMAQLDLELDVANVPARDATVRYLQFERTVTLGKPVRVIRRGEFDHSLIQQVAKRGVEVVFGESVRGLTRHAHGVTVHTSRRDIECDVVIGADGAASVVRKALARRSDGEVPHRLFKLEVENVVSAGDAPAMLYDFSLMARGLRGYSWVFPLVGDCANVGLMHYPAKDQRLGGKALTELLRLGLADVGIEIGERGARGWPVWGYHPRTPVAAPRVLTVGDAAGIDGLTGEGISVAMEQALIAADEVEVALVVGDLGFDDYPRKLRRSVTGRELNLDRRLASMLYGGPSWRRWLSLILFDDEMLGLYAARVDGTDVLADQPGRLLKALLRHGFFGGQRLRRLSEVEGAA